MNVYTTDKIRNVVLLGHGLSLIHISKSGFIRKRGAAI